MKIGPKVEFCLEVFGRAGFYCQNPKFTEKKFSTKINYTPLKI